MLNITRNKIKKLLQELRCKHDFQTWSKETQEYKHHVVENRNLVCTSCGHVSDTYVTVRMINEKGGLTYE